MEEYLYYTYNDKIIKVFLDNFNIFQVKNLFEKLSKDFDLEQINYAFEHFKRYYPYESESVENEDIYYIIMKNLLIGQNQKKLN